MHIQSGTPVCRVCMLLLAALGAFLAGPAAAVQPDDLLHPDQAFRVSATPLAADMVRVEWEIAEGYYLYKGKISFRSADPGVELGPPMLPEAHDIKHDEFFGESAIYRGHVAVDIPLIRADARHALDFSLIAKSQGCADAGVCFPPREQTLSVSLAAAPGGPPKSGGVLGGFLNSVKDTLGLGGAGEEFLDPDQAFVFAAGAQENKAFHLQWQIADGYYLYRKQLKVTLKDSPGVTLGELVLPPGRMKTDESFGHSEVYYHKLDVRVPVVFEGEGRSVTAEVRYQGCADAGLCYAPITKTVALTLPAGGAGPAPAPVIPAVSGFVSEQDRFAQSLMGGNRLLTMLSFFGVGLLLAFTPCVFPMVPILSSLIVGQGASITTRNAFFLSLAYVLAMALTYTVAGVLAGLFGANLQAAFQNAWVIGAFSALFVALALSMFGFYDLQLPASWQSRLSEISNRQQGGTLAGASIMGLLSALIVGPCVAAPLAGALIYIGNTGDAVLGGLALFAMSLGMGVPLLAVGTSAGKWLPRASGWMNTIKAVFGVLLLGLAIWMLERVIPGQLALVLWGALFIVTAVFLGVANTLPVEATGWQKLWKGVGFVFLVYGVVLTLGAATGGNSMFKPLANASFLGGGQASAPALPFVRIKGPDGLDQALQRARAQGQPVMLDFYADWCVSCKEMEHLTFSDPAVQAALAGVMLLQADVTANDEADKALMARFGIFGPPSILFFGVDGTERKAYRVVGFLDAGEFASHVQQALERSL
ncbi:MAG TPA: protein-disulfide reductase DsbD [Gammaproteobacteria bacterium]|nr:protein-disulfide reductase DsbD [Gammaproteobacteria bacterium]